jgi:CheY-like chemotaxis protein
LSCEVLGTEDPVELFGACQSGDVVLVLMDVSLKNSAIEGRQVSGLDLSRELKKDARSRSIPVVLATAHAMHGDRQRLLAGSGADAYVTKPVVDLAQFVSILKSLIGAKA